VKESLATKDAKDTRAGGRSARGGQQKRDQPKQDQPKQAAQADPEAPEGAPKTEAADGGNGA
jgi:hypothetical protein